MKIQIEIDVFDDPKFCREHGFFSKVKKCQNLGNESHENFCNGFSEYLHYIADVPTKCDECKTKYLNACLKKQSKGLATTRTTGTAGKYGK